MDDGYMSYVQGIMVTVCINIIAVCGVSILTGFTRLFSFGNAGFMSVGAYVSALLTLRAGVPLMLALCIGSVTAGAVSLLLGKLTLKLKGDYFLITTLGFGECVRVLFNYLRPITGGAQGLSGIKQHSMLFIIVIASTVVCIFLAWMLLHSKYGRNLTAIREQEIAAEAVGINVASSKQLAFTASAMMAGWAGGLLANYMMFITPVMFNLPRSAELTITVVIGGLGSLTGSVMASMIITLLPEIFSGMAEYKMFLYGLAVVLIIILRPNGLMGYTEFSPRGIWRWSKSLPQKIRSIPGWFKSLPQKFKKQEVGKG